MLLKSSLPLASRGHWNLTSGITTVIVRDDVIALAVQTLDSLRDKECKRNWASSEGEEV